VDGRGSRGGRRVRGRESQGGCCVVGRDKLGGRGKSRLRVQVLDPRLKALPILSLKGRMAG
jgi:hypothetical protein